MNKALIEKLEDGNKKYVNNMRHARKRHESSKGQNPYAIILTCSDSRVSPEYIFDADIGDFFIVRTAGLALSDVELGSIEFAIATFDINVIIVLGHTMCGAIEASMNGKKYTSKLARIAKSVYNRVVGAKSVEEAERFNVLYACNEISLNPVVEMFLDKGKIVVLPAIYDTKEGSVDFLFEYNYECGWLKKC